jgi:hypothetical protein
LTRAVSASVTARVAVATSIRRWRLPEISIGSVPVNAQCGVSLSYSKAKSGLGRWPAASTPATSIGAGRPRRHGGRAGVGGPRQGVVQGQGRRHLRGGRRGEDHDQHHRPEACYRLAAADVSDGHGARGGSLQS